MNYRVIPSSREHFAFTQSSCVFSVSISADASMLDRLVRGFRWAAETFQTVNVYLGDGPLLETTLLLLGTQKGDVKLQSRGLSSLILEELNKISPVKLCTSAKSLAKDSSFKVLLAETRKLYRTNHNFQLSIDNDAKSYVSRLEKRERLGLPAEKAVSMAVDYLLFEIAGYCHLADNGFLVDVYSVGSDELPTLKRFMSGNLPKFHALEDRTCILIR